MHVSMASDAPASIRTVKKARKGPTVGHRKTAQYIGPVPLCHQLFFRRCGGPSCALAHPPGGLSTVVTFADTALVSLIALGWNVVLARFNVRLLMQRRHSLKRLAPALG
eukprot:957926-Pyramimonas_sp.AAC.2